MAQILKRASKQAKALLKLKDEQEKAEKEIVDTVPEDLRRIESGAALIIHKAGPALLKALMMKDTSHEELKELKNELDADETLSEEEFERLWTPLEEMRQLGVVLEDVIFDIQQIEAKSRWLARLTRLVHEGGQVFDLYNDLANKFSEYFGETPAMMEQYRDKLSTVALNQRKVNEIFENIHKSHQAYRRLQRQPNPRAKEAYRKYRIQKNLGPQ